MIAYQVTKREVHAGLPTVGFIDFTFRDNALYRNPSAAAPLSQDELLAYVREIIPAPTMVLLDVEPTPSPWLPEWPWTRVEAWNDACVQAVEAIRQVVTGARVALVGVPICVNQWVREGLARDDQATVSGTHVLNGMLACQRAPSNRRWWGVIDAVDALAPMMYACRSVDWRMWFPRVLEEAKRFAKPCIPLLAPWYWPDSAASPILPPAEFAAQVRMLEAAGINEVVFWDGDSVAQRAAGAEAIAAGVLEVR